ncbi:MAG: DNA integrity scanning protein DisA nucleotide-binding domain protein [Planctomycetaceae bacterium]
MTGDVFCDICQEDRRGIDRELLQSILYLAVEIAREGREGRKIGTILVVGDEQAVLGYSRPLILDPLHGHPPEHKQITEPDVRESIKELAQLDGAFVISGDGVAVSAARYIDVSSEGVRLPLGLGSRHIAAASVTRITKAVAVVVSESSIVRVFDNGELISEIIPELWMFRRYALSMEESRIIQRSSEDLTVRTKAD